MKHANANVTKIGKVYKHTVVHPYAVVNVNETANAASRSIHRPISANVNAIELTEYFDDPLQPGSKNDIPHSHTTFCVFGILALMFRICVLYEACAVNCSLQC